MSATQSVSLRLTVTVQPLTLPHPRDWAFRLDLWQNHWVVARHHHLQPWSDQHKALLREHLRRYAEAGGKYITTHAVHSPWQDNSYTLEETMIEWIKGAVGAWRFDYRVFDEYVTLANHLHASALGEPLPLSRRGDREPRRGVLAAGSGRLPPPLACLLDDLERHLERRGWLGRTYLGINENPLPDTLAAVETIRAHSKRWIPSV